MSMEAFSAVAGQLAAVVAAVRTDVGTHRIDAATQGAAQGTLTDIRFLVKGINLLMVCPRSAGYSQGDHCGSQLRLLVFLQIVVGVVVVVLSISAVLLDWAHFYRGINVQASHAGGYEGELGYGGPVVVNVHRGDGMGLIIVKSVIGSVLGFLIVNLLKARCPLHGLLSICGTAGTGDKLIFGLTCTHRTYTPICTMQGTATPQYISTLGRSAQVEPQQVVNAYHTAVAYMAARRSVLCSGAAVACGLGSGVCLWSW